MGDPLNPSGNPVSAPITQNSSAETQEVKHTGRKFNRSVSVIEASPQKGLRARAKNFLPRPLYQFLVSLVSVDHKAQYKLGKAISQAREDSNAAWQELGKYHALPKSEQDSKKIYELQLDCKKKDLKLDLLQGWGDSPVTAEKRTVIKLLEQCVEAPEDETAKAAYEDACKKLKKTEYSQETLRLKRSDLKKELKSLTPLVEAAKPISIRQSLELSAQLDPPKLTEQEKQKEEAILKKGTEAFERQQAIKKELTTLETKIRQHDNMLVDVESAREALFHFEKVHKVRDKGAS